MCQNALESLPETAVKEMGQGLAKDIWPRVKNTETGVRRPWFLVQPHHYKVTLGKSLPFFGYLSPNL